ncbi:uncharacterized protein SPPG_06901 [Spizellomyces punctatus DAOM BR117]|uniref:DNA damage-inducible protein 1 n=1 Tax=Spizellomyces punctatus (strain DAOM BR117) TaxID=645134 RepID=A0A0L0H8Q2_SPIPD|nr:uncharacterized protein SPPG_06901 [Spizellomyces punctatus DAOM BR117]KNC97910.1 hypothetical protein SPPG_06901 [Spizellomyces punctatus DAOM BR117]|eukprot:XP_016605950.1 hypothetical protein SPPG_06901 [Spizellomyces punctatus DAOM BR117]
MRIHLTYDNGEVHNVDVDGSMELENLMAIVEAEMNIPAGQQVLLHNGVELTEKSKSITASGIRPDDILLVRRRSPAGSNITRTPESIAETVRQQILADPWMLQQLSSQQPELANAAMNDPATFQRMYLELESRRRELEERQRQQMAALDSADPFDIDAQRRIEEEIRKQNIAQNLENAMEYHPESFGRVVMLYIDTEVNGHKVKAFVDSGAQATIMSPALAEACNIMHLLDERFAGIAQGVGTAKILGRVHSAQMKIGSQFLPCSFTIMEGKGVDLLFGLDMLKRHQAIIDLEKNVLRIHGEEVRFLSEHELPDKARWEATGSGDVQSPVEGGSAAQGAVHPPGGLHPHIPPAGIAASVPGPGAAQAGRLGAPTGAPTSTTAGAVPRHSEEKIKMLEDLGVSRAEAIAALDASGGNADAAASMLFQ